MRIIDGGGQQVSEQTSLEACCGNMVAREWLHNQNNELKVLPGSFEEMTHK